jgi:hypothetical protein
MQMVMHVGILWLQGVRNLRLQVNDVENLRMQAGEHDHHMLLGQPVTAPSLVLPSRTSWSWGHPAVAATATAVYTPCSSSSRRHVLLVLLLSLPLALRTVPLSSISHA